MSVKKHYLNHSVITWMALVFQETFSPYESDLHLSFAGGDSEDFASSIVQLLPRSGYFIVAHSIYDAGA